MDDKQKKTNPTFRFNTLSLKSRRRILFIGPTGSGKSLIVNYLYHDDIFPRYYVGKKGEVVTFPAVVSGRMEHVTRKFASYYSSQTGLFLTDTVGFGDKEITNSQIVSSVKDLLWNSRSGYNKIYFVFKLGRATAETRSYFDIVSCIFGPNLRDRVSLLVTSAEEADCDDFRKMQTPEDIEFLDKNFSNIIVGDFHISEKDKEKDAKYYQKDRLSFLSKIKEDIDKSPESFVTPRITTMNDFQRLLYALYNKIIELFYPQESNSIDLLSELNLHLDICPYCYQMVAATSTEEAKPILLSCGHSYHEICLITALNQSPYCYYDGCTKYLTLRSLEDEKFALTGDPFRFFQGKFNLLTDDIHLIVEKALKQEKTSEGSIVNMRMQVDNHVLLNDKVRGFQTKYKLLDQELKAILYYMVGVYDIPDSPPESLYSKLNKRLADRPQSSTLGVWQPYLYYFFNGLLKLPPYEGTVYRGLSTQLRKWVEYKNSNKSVMIITTTSTNKDQNVLTSFSPAHQPGTWIKLEIKDGRDVSDLSFYSQEKEVILLPNTSIKIISTDRSILKKEFVCSGEIPEHTLLVYAVQEKQPTDVERRKLLGLN